MKYIVLTVIFLLEIALVVLGFNADWMKQQIDREHAAVSTYVGQDAANTLQLKALHTFEYLFVESGIRQASYDQFVPATKEPQHGMENLAPWLFAWMKRRLDTFWWLMYSALFRLFEISMWLLPFGPIVVAAFIDGYTTRQVRQDNHEYANPIRYKAAGRSLLLLAFCPFIFVALPFAMNPVFIPVWIALTALAIMMVVTHTQHRM